MLDSIKKQQNQTMLIIPSYLGASNTTGLINFSSQVLNQSNEVINCDASYLNFVDPLALCILSATCHEVSSKGQKINILNLNDNMNSYLARMDVFENCNIDIQTTNQRHDRSDSLVEVCILDDCSQIPKLSSQIAHAIVGQTPESTGSQIPDEMTGYTEAERLTVPIEYIFSELLENALTHGKRGGFHEASVWVAAQYYPKRDSIRLAIVDNGCGYLETLQTHPQLIARSHEGAISTALLPDVSCNNDLGLMGESINQGIGLTVVKDLAVSAGGTISIISGDRALSKGATHTRISVNDNWQGSIVFLQVPRNSLKTLNIHEVIRPYQQHEDTPHINFE